MRKLLALAVMGLMSTSAAAADLGGQGGGYKDDSGYAAPCAGVTWTGLRIGGLIGVGATGTGTGTASGSNSDGSWTDNLNVSGAYQLSTVGQLEIGGDYQFKNSGFVIGAFGDIGYGSGAAELTYSGNIRAGFAMGNALVYGFGGVEKSHLVHDISFLSTNKYLATLKADPTGFVYGAGVDVALGHGWYAGVRAERVDYGSVTAKGSAGGISYAADISASDNRGFLTVGYKF